MMAGKKHDPEHQHDDYPGNDPRQPGSPFWLGLLLGEKSPRPAVPCTGHGSDFTLEPFRRNPAPVTAAAHFTNSSFDFSATLVTMGRLNRQAFDPCPRSESHAGDTRRNPERPAAPLSRSEGKQVAGVRLPCRDPGRG